MRLVESLPETESPQLRVRAEKRELLAEWLLQEIEDAHAARFEQEAVWREAFRQYEGVPKNPVRNFPVENAPNIEITLGAISSDAIYAQSIDTIFSVNPVVTVRPTQSGFLENAKRFQRWIDWIVANEINLRPAAEETILDDVQIGTGIYYVPWVEHVKKTSSRFVKARGPRIISIPPEDFFVPGGADSDLQLAPWVAMRTWLTPGDLELRAKSGNWNIDGVVPVGNVSFVRSQRETLGHTRSNRKISELYEIYDVYAHFDIDGDGIEEDLLIIWDRTSRKILKLVYNPFDRRPFEVSRYQLRSHLFYGIGVMELVRPFQEEETELHNYALLNILLANTRLWKARTNSVPENFKLWPNKVVSLDNPEDLQSEQMGEVYPSIFQAQAQAIAMAERRVGLNELALPRASQVLGSRTPGITALSLLQQVNRRFTPAFDSIRLSTAGAVKQAVYRYQERVLAGDQNTENQIREVLGQEDGEMVIELLKSPRFDDAVSIELTASSASVNRETDRQNALALVNILSAYYQRTLELVTIASSPDAPPQVKEVAQKIASAAGEAIERTIRTFDQVRDPERFIVEIEEELDQLQGVGQEGLQGLLGLLGQVGVGSAPRLPTVA